MSENKPVGAGRRRRRAALAAAAGATAAAVTVALIQPSHGSGAGTPVNGPDMINTLVALLPEDLPVGEASGSGPSTTQEPHVYLTVEDGTEGWGADLSLSLDRWGTDDWRADAGCAGRAAEMGSEEEGYTCEEQELADGRVLSLTTWEYEDSWTDDEDAESWRSISWEARLEGAGGSGADDFGGRSVSLTLGRDLMDVEDPDSYRPPLDLDQLGAIAQAPVWADTLDAVDAKYGPPEEWVEEPIGTIPPEELRRVFRGLAPEGLELTDGPEAEPGLATLLADDGKGPVLVEITAWDAEYEGGGEEGDGGGVAGHWDSEEWADADVEEWAADESCVEDTLEDGTEVMACHYPADAGDPLAVWWATVYYPDGSSLSLTQLNAPDYEAQPEREDAPLTLDELRDIALADEWRELAGV